MYFSSPLTSHHGPSGVRADRQQIRLTKMPLILEGGPREHSTRAKIYFESLLIHRKKISEEGQNVLLHSTWLNYFNLENSVIT